MKTRKIKISEQVDRELLKPAAELLIAGELVAFPTETVYGLGADATNPQAIEKIFVAKGRPSDNPLIVHVASEKQVKALTTDYPAYVDKMIKAFSPGPITYVLPSNGKVAKNVTAGLDTVGIRIPNHHLALALLQACKLPIAAPSANTSGKPSPTRASHVLDDLSGKIAAVVDGGIAEVGLESTVVDCTGPYPIILRLGQVTAKQIESITGKVGLLHKQADKGSAPKSPGLKYKHYAPEVPLYLVQDNKKLKQIIAEEQKKGNRVGLLIHQALNTDLPADETIVLGAELGDIAAHLYEALRRLRKDTVDVIISASFPSQEMGAAIMDRLQRAATKII